MEPMLDTYNDNSTIQATCQRVGNPMLATMAQAYGDTQNGIRLMRIAEYGCSGGRNSTAPMQNMIAMLHTTRPDLRAECVLEDLPSNPWHLVMQEVPKLTGAFGGNVQVLCAGTSFYDQVCADDSLDLAYSYVAVHFLSSAPPLASHVMMHEGTPEERAAWSAQAAKDWERFLLLRARELKKGARMMLSTMGRDQSGYSWQQFSHLVWDAIRAVHADGALTKQEMETLCIPASLRSEEEVLAPFRSGGAVAESFKVDSFDFLRTEIDGERAVDIAVLAPRLRKRVEAVWGGMFVAQLIRLGRTEASAREVMDEVWDRFEDAMAADPSRGWLDMRSYYLQVTRK
jgi:hypothetical protein